MVYWRIVDSSKEPNENDPVFCRRCNRRAVIRTFFQLRQWSCPICEAQGYTVKFRHILDNENTFDFMKI